jgi:hypothetical protein
VKGEEKLAENLLADDPIRIEIPFDEIDAPGRNLAPIGVAGSTATLAAPAIGLAAPAIAVEAPAVAAEGLADAVAGLTGAVPRLHRGFSRSFWNRHIQDRLG